MRYFRDITRHDQIMPDKTCDVWGWRNLKLARSCFWLCFAMMEWAFIVIQCDTPVQVVIVGIGYGSHLLFFSQLGVVHSYRPRLADSSNAKVLKPITSHHRRHLKDREDMWKHVSRMWSHDVSWNIFRVPQISTTLFGGLEAQPKTYHFSYDCICNPLDHTGSHQPARNRQIPD